VLLDWVDAKDPQLSVAALEVVASLTKRPMEAALARDRLAILREAIAIEAIRSLGGVVENDRNYGVGLVVGGNAPKQIVLSDDWKGGVDGLKHIADVRTATTLSLWSAPLGDAAVSKLGDFTNLRRIELYGLSLTPELVDDVRKKLPNTMVEVRGGARLGIRGIDSIEVLPNSPAAKAGIMPRDLVTEFAGVEIKSFEDLTAQISKCKPGDTVTVKVKRGEQLLDKQVTFDRWGDDVASAIATPAAPVGQQGLFAPIPAPAPQPIPDGMRRLADPSRR
jgi:membrane-associated protease RseP (regulator of RpoE activity)